MTRHLTRERRIVLAILNAMQIDIESVSKEDYERFLVAAGTGMRDGFPDDVLEIFYKQDEMIWNQ